MGVTSTLPSSRRGYLSQDELKQYVNITINDIAEADDVINQAEEMIDGFVGYQNKFMVEKVEGRMAANTPTSFTLQSNQQNNYDINYFSLCEIEIIGGTGQGQRRKITTSTKAGVQTIDVAWTTTPSTDSFYRIYQLGKFPRACDVVSYSEQTPTTYYKQIPEAVKRAVAAQIGFMIEMGDAYFAGSKSDYQSESIGDYSYSKGAGSNNDRLIGPRVQTLLNGIYKRTGRLLV